MAAKFWWNFHEFATTAPLSLNDNPVQVQSLQTKYNKEVAGDISRFAIDNTAETHIMTRVN